MNLYKYNNTVKVLLFEKKNFGRFLKMVDCVRETIKFLRIMQTWNKASDFNNNDNNKSSRERAKHENR